jgi:hypothetical protein
LAGKDFPSEKSRKTWQRNSKALIPFRVFLLCRGEKRRKTHLSIGGEEALGLIQFDPLATIFLRR